MRRPVLLSKNDEIYPTPGPFDESRSALYGHLRASFFREILRNPEIGFVLEVRPVSGPPVFFIQGGKSEKFVSPLNSPS
jgi:hypothetical protein